MSEPNSKTEKPKEERQYSQKQFELLNSCNAKKDMSAWNQWREENPDEKILLEGASFWQAYLKGADLKGANLVRADLRGAKLTGSNLEHANLYDAKLQNARIGEAVLRHANLEGADIRGTSFWHANLESAKCDAAIVDGFTLLWGCKVDRCTNFIGVGLSSARIRPGLRQLLEYNVRRMNWEEWYKEHTFLKILFKSFWWISDYGMSTKQIIFTFFGLAFVFALLYRLFPNFVMVYGNIGDIQGFWHALYFSVVTMTTLGFGDIAANPNSWIGQTLLMLQVILGYVLLGALVTRFAVLFTAGGPAGKFANEKEKEDEKK
jgi:hypothetical protein